MSARKTIAAPKWHGQEAVQYSASVPAAIDAAVQIVIDEQNAAYDARRAA